MAYTPTEWKCGDVVSAEKLNKLEEGLAECCGGAEPNGWVIEAESFHDCHGVEISKNLVKVTITTGGTSREVSGVVAYSDLSEEEIMALDYIDVSSIAALDAQMFRPPFDSKVKPLAVSPLSVGAASSSTNVAHLDTDTQAISCTFGGLDVPAQLLILPTNADVRYDCK